MAGIKDYNRKLRSFKNTKKITKTMKMVAASKLRKAHHAQANAKTYEHEITNLLARIVPNVPQTEHPLFNKKPEPKKALILIFTSDKGLCGAFNHNANKQALSWIEANKNTYSKIDVSCCGKKGFQFFQRRRTIKNYYETPKGDPQFSQAIKIGDDLIKSFINGEYDEIHLVYNQFLSPLVQKSIFQKILPIDPSVLPAKKEKSTTDYLFEPGPAELFQFIIPHFVYFKIYFAMLENSAGEHASRMTSMDNATRNASELIDQYTLLRNRARQAKITTEIMEIISGAEALK